MQDLGNIRLAAQFLQVRLHAVNMYAAQIAAIRQNLGSPLMHVRSGFLFR